MVKDERLSFDELNQIQQTGERMREQLVAMIRDVPPRLQIDSNRFLTSLLYEARLVAG